METTYHNTFTEREERLMRENERLRGELEELRQRYEALLKEQRRADQLRADRSSMGGKDAHP